MPSRAIWQANLSAQPRPDSLRETSPATVMNGFNDSLEKQEPERPQNRSGFLRFSLPFPSELAHVRHCTLPFLLLLPVTA